MSFEWAVELGPVLHMRSGFWAPTTLRIERNLNRIRGRVPNECVAFFRATYGPEAAAELTTAIAGQPQERLILWTGVAHNLVALCAAGLLVWSLVLNARRLQPLLPSQRRRRRGACPTCGYDLTGLAEGPCPECGAPRNPRPPAPYRPAP
jgi:hypothetical protein